MLPESKDAAQASPFQPLAEKEKTFFWTGMTVGTHLHTCPFLFTPMIPAVGSWGAVTKMVSPLILFM